MGSVQQILCAPGTYSNSDKSDCQPCEAGSYCDPYPNDSITPVADPIICPPGYYCPSGTRNSAA